MAVVIDQIESTVEPESGHTAGGAGQGSGAQPQQPFATDRIEAEILRVERRQARLRAD